MPIVNSLALPHLTEASGGDTEPSLQSSMEKGKSRRNSSKEAGILSSLPTRRRGSTASDAGNPAPRRNSLPELVALQPTPDDEPIMTMEQFEATIERFGEFHIGQMSGLKDNVHSLQAEVGSLSMALSNAQNQRDQRTETAKAMAKNRALSREQKINELSSENATLIREIDSTHRAINQLQEKIGMTENRLVFLDQESDRKTKVISSQAGLIKSGKEVVKTIKTEHDDLLEIKDREILNLKQELDSTRTQLTAVQQERDALHKKSGVVATTASGLTPEKTAALVKSGKNITDRSDVLQALNGKLIEECKTLRANNKSNLETIQQLKGQLERLMTVMGIDPSTGE